MLALKINNVKIFMNQLLNETVFDRFFTAEASVTTWCRFEIDGSLHREFFDSDGAELAELGDSVYASWEKIRPFCYSVIKGKLPPVSFKIALLLTPEQVPDILKNDSPSFAREGVSSLFLNIQYRNREVLCTTGISRQIFSLSKEAESAWDSMILDFFGACRFDFEKV